MFSLDTLRHRQDDRWIRLAVLINLDVWFRYDGVHRIQSDLHHQKEQSSYKFRRMFWILVKVTGGNNGALSLYNADTSVKKPFKP